MDGRRFDHFTRQLAESRIGRRGFLAGALGLGAGSATLARVVQAQDPTPAPGDMAANDDDGGALESQFPCPVPGGPFDWICGSGPWGPWYPMIAPAELTAATGIRWHGVAPTDTGGFEGKAFTQAGQVISSYESEAIGDELRWSISDAETSIGGSIKLPAVAGELSGLELQLNGVLIPVEVRDGVMQSPSEMTQLEFDRAGDLLIHQWQTAAERLDGLLQFGFRSDEDTLEASSTGCAVAGFVLGVTWVGCLAGPAGCLPAAGATSYIANKCTDSW
jgi:hypothetical protein